MVSDNRFYDPQDALLRELEKRATEVVSTRSLAAVTRATYRLYRIGFIDPAKR